MSALSEIVSVTITKESSFVTRAGFSTPIFLTPHSVTANRVDYYGSLTEMTDAGFATSDEAYKWATAIWSQEISPNRVAIGRQDAADLGDYSVTLAAIADEDITGWYFINCESRADAAVLDVYTWAQANDKLYIAQSSTAGILAGTGVFDTMYSGNNYRTAGLYFSDDTVYADGAWTGRCAAFNLDAVGGVGTWALKSLSGPTADSFTAAQRGFMDADNVNYIHSVGGKTIVQYGTTASASWYIDEVTTIDWLTARMAEDVFALLTGTSTKIPFTQAGIDQVEAIVRGRLQIAVDNGHLESYTVSIPALADVSASDKTARNLTNVQFSGVLAGAIHKVTIQGTVSV